MLLNDGTTPNERLQQTEKFAVSPKDIDGLVKCFFEILERCEKEADVNMPQTGVSKMISRLNEFGRDYFNGGEGYNSSFNSVSGIFVVEHKNIKSDKKPVSRFCFYFDSAVDIKHFDFWTDNAEIESGMMRRIFDFNINEVYGKNLHAGSILAATNKLYNERTRQGAEAAKADSTPCGL